MTPQPQPRRSNGDRATVVGRGLYDAAVEARENANAVSVRVEAENRRLREGIEALIAELPTVDDQGVACPPPYRERLRGLLNG